MQPWYPGMPRKAGCLAQAGLTLVYKGSGLGEAKLEGEHKVSSSPGKESGLALCRGTPGFTADVCLLPMTALYSLLGQGVSRE